MNRGLGGLTLLSPTTIWRLDISPPLKNKRRFIYSQAASDGIYRCSDVIENDLKPLRLSLFLHPHAQHGLVIRRNIQDADTFFGLESNVITIIRLKNDRVAEWIGEGDWLSTYNLFRSPAYEYGYELLLHRQDLFENELQKITQYV